MAILTLVTEPDPLLHQVSSEVEAVDDSVRRLLDDMLETMYAEEGVGLAAVQVGVLKRLLVMDLGDEGGGPYRMVNPVITEKSVAKRAFKEGCLSFPGERAEVSRPETVTVSYLNERGEVCEMRCMGLAAVCVQHEIDHLNGVVFVDYLSKLKRDIIVKRLKKRR